MDPSTLTGERPITAAADGRAYRLLEAIAEMPDATSRAQRAGEIIRDHLRERPLTDQQRLANAALDLLTGQPRVRPVSDVAQALRTSPRTLQRAIGSTLGRGPAEVARRVRLQEVVRRLSSQHSSVANIATDLGYTDQAHLTNEFRAVTGMTPGSYLAGLLAGEHRPGAHSEGPAAVRRRRSLTGSPPVSLPRRNRGAMPGPATPRPESATPKWNGRGPLPPESPGAESRARVSQQGFDGRAGQAGLCHPG